MRFGLFDDRHKWIIVLLQWRSIDAWGRFPRYEVNQQVER